MCYAECGQGVVSQSTRWCEHEVFALDRCVFYEMAPQLSCGAILRFRGSLGRAGAAWVAGHPRGPAGMGKRPLGVAAGP